MKLGKKIISSGVVIQLPGGTWEVDANQLLLANLRDVVISGCPDTVLVCQTPDPIMTISACSNVTLRDLTFQGPGPLHEPNSVYSALVSLTGAYERLRFENVTLLNMANHGIADLDTRIGHDVSFVRCQASNGGNYGNNTGLRWDGAAFAVGVEGVSYSHCKVTDCIRAFEMENPKGDCTFSLNHCYVSQCSHVCAWITPTGGETGTTGQRFTGSVTNCVFEAGALVPGGFNPSGIVCTGGTEIVIANNTVRGFRDGSGIQCRADHAPLRDFVITGNLLRDCKVGLVFAAGIEGAKCPANSARLTGNLVVGSQTGFACVTDGATNVQIV